MAVPKRKTTRSKRNMRRSHDAVTPVNFALCPQCHEPSLPHRVCSFCGHYAGREIINTEEG